MSKRITASAYVVITPTWNRNRITGARLDRMTRGKPQQAPAGSAIVHLNISLPERVFRAFEANADVTAQAGDVGIARVTIQPFAEEEEGEGKP